MDPVTHLLSSYALARAMRNRLASPEMAVFLLGGLAPDVDWFWRLGPPLHPLRAYGTAGHSLLGAGALALAVAAAAWAASRRNALPGASFLRLAGAGATGAALHVLLDLCANTGIELFWPFRVTRISWNLAEGFDPILLALLALCAFLPALLSLVSEEIGARKDARAGRGWGVTALLLVMLYLGGRWILRDRAVTLLANARFHSRAPLHWEAFPEGVSLFAWRGMVETEATLEEIEVRVGPGDSFDPDRSRTHFKPDPSPIVDAVAKTSLAGAFRSLARFPVLSIEHTLDGYRTELRDLGGPPLRTPGGAWVARVELDEQGKSRTQELDFVPEKKP
jgi:membrane-bound metal-dependent hydrolase YbcI (DUF457 family)